MLITTTHYAIPREEDGRTNVNFRYLWEKAMAWHPEIEEAPDAPSGLSALHLLRDGNAIPEHKLDAARGYLQAAIGYYGSGPWEPYEGRNMQAARDMQNLLDQLEVVD